MTAEDDTIFALRTTANREDQVMDFVSSNAKRKGLDVYSIVRPHGMRGYIFIEATSRADAEQAAFNVPYARGILPKPIEYREIEHMLEQVKKEVKKEYSPMQKSGKRDYMCTRCKYKFKYDPSGDNKFRCPYCSSPAYVTSIKSLSSGKLLSEINDFD